MSSIGLYQSMILAVDFDDTLMDNIAVRPGYKMGPPTGGAVGTLTRLSDEGHQIIIFTARNVQDKRIHDSVADWLKYFKVPFHGITNIKSDKFDIIIDNRALHYQSWPQVHADLRKAVQGWGVWSNHVSDHRPTMIDDITKPLA